MYIFGAPIESEGLFLIREKFNELFVIKIYMFFVSN